MAFTRNGELKGAYNHWDSYPSGLGDAIAYWLAEADLADAQAKFDALKVVDEDSKPTPEEIKNSLAQYDSFDDPKKAALAALPTDNKNPEEMVDFFAEFVEWMRGAVDHEGFRVY
jgi:hypothetical protein